MTSAVPGLFVGWQAVEHGEPPVSPLLDDPPVRSDPAELLTAHQQWRVQVEQDERRILGVWHQQPHWFPVPVFQNGGVLPVFGGGPLMWSKLAATVALLSAQAGFSRIRLVNLTQVNVFDEVRRLARRGAPMSVRSDTLSAKGSTFDPFGNLPLDELAGLAVDVVRAAGDAGRRSAIQDKRALLSIGAALTGATTLTRLAEAIAVALGDHRAGASLSPVERSQLADYNRRIVVPRPQVVGRLDDLQHTLEELLCYQRNKGIQAMKTGRGAAVRTVEPAVSSTSHEHELGRELLGRATARGFAAPTAGGDVLVVVGADHLATEVLDHLTSTTAQAGKHLVLIFGKITADAERLLGHGGSGCAVFLRLPNHNDARVAAEYLGREFTFVVNGYSISDGDTVGWTESHGTSSGRSSSVSASSSASAALVGKTIAIGRSFGTSVTKSFDSSESYNASIGGSHQHTNTVNTSRVHDYVLEPEKFQHLEDDMMLVVDRQTVVLANCDPDISVSPMTSPTPLGP